MDRSIQEQGAVTGCFGCGPDNSHGLQLKSFVEGDETVAWFEPQAYHCAGSPDIVYGGLIACLLDCHSCNFAIARHYREEQREIGSQPKIFCVTAQLNISLLRPTPIGQRLEIRARLKSAEGRKTWVESWLLAAGEVCARGEILAIRVKQEGA